MDASTRSKLLVDAINDLRNELLRIRNYLAIPFDETRECAEFSETKPPVSTDFFSEITRDDEPLEENKLLINALKVITEVGYASPLVLQHRLEINYRQAVCLMYRLERDGYVEPSYGFRPRKLINTNFELDQSNEQTKLC